MEASGHNFMMEEEGSSGRNGEGGEAGPPPDLWKLLPNGEPVPWQKDGRIPWEIDLHVDDVRARWEADVIRDVKWYAAREDFGSKEFEMIFCKMVLDKKVTTVGGGIMYDAYEDEYAIRPLMKIFDDILWGNPRLNPFDQIYLASDGLRQHKGTPDKYLHWTWFPNMIGIWGTLDPSVGRGCHFAPVSQRPSGARRNCMSIAFRPCYTPEGRVHHRELWIADDDRRVLMQHFRDFEDPMVPGSDFEACQTYPEVRYWQAWDLGPAVATWYYVFWFKFKGEHPVQGWKWNGGGARLPLDAFVDDFGFEVNVQRLWEEDYWRNYTASRWEKRMEEICQAVKSAFAGEGPAAAEAAYTAARAVNNVRDVYDGPLYEDCMAAGAEAAARAVAEAKEQEGEAARDEAGAEKRSRAEARKSAAAETENKAKAEAQKKAETKAKAKDEKGAEQRTKALDDQQEQAAVGGGGGVDSQRAQTRTVWAQEKYGMMKQERGGGGVRAKAVLDEMRSRDAAGHALLPSAGQEMTPKRRGRPPKNREAAGLAVSTAPPDPPPSNRLPPPPRDGVALGLPSSTAPPAASPLINARLQAEKKASFDAKVGTGVKKKEASMVEWGEAKEEASIEAKEEASIEVEEEASIEAKEEASIEVEEEASIEVEEEAHRPGRRSEGCAECRSNKDEPRTTVVGVSFARGGRDWSRWVEHGPRRQDHEEM